MADERGSDGRRQVAVPMSIYKVVTVLTTFLAVVGIVVGFILIDRGTDRARAAPDDVDLLVTGFGVGLIVLAAAMYAFSTRFTPPERANDKGTSTEAGDENG